ncbi:MAG: four helix bundle protein [Planctomycetes bacterium]|nr:four helix bundle protein [Planctomycetota bacterium]
MEQTRGYRDLIAWRRGLDLVEQVYLLARHLPPEERFELSGQLRKAVVSVPANIAEGQARRGPSEFLYHLGIARGSLAEVDTLLEVALRVGYFCEPDLVPVQALLVDVRRLLQRLIEGIERWSGLKDPSLPNAEPRSLSASHSPIPTARLNSERRTPNSGPRSLSASHSPVPAARLNSGRRTPNSEPRSLSASHSPIPSARLNSERRTPDAEPAADKPRDEPNP